MGVVCITFLNTFALVIGEFAGGDDVACGAAFYSAEVGGAH
jgi:hypothetical protein